MEFSGEFELEGVSAEDAWVVLSDPQGVRAALPGCKFLTRIDDKPDFDFDAYEAEHSGEEVPVLPEADPDEVAERAFVEGGRYAALVQVGVGSVKPRFETEVEITSREFPRMEAKGSGSASSSAFDMTAWMEIEETETGSKVYWGTEADVSGKVAQLGKRVLNPVANKIVGNYFSNVEEQMSDLKDADAADEDEGGVTDRLRNLI
ncbi:MAG: CoxG family protein [Haloferacaceae archaeon]